MGEKRRVNFGIEYSFEIIVVMIKMILVFFSELLDVFYVLAEEDQSAALLCLLGGGVYLEYVCHEITRGAFLVEVGPAVFGVERRDQF